MCCVSRATERRPSMCKLTQVADTDAAKMTNDACPRYQGRHDQYHDQGHCPCRNPNRPNDDVRVALVCFDGLPREQKKDPKTCGFELVFNSARSTLVETVSPRAHDRSVESEYGPVYDEVNNRGYASQGYVDSVSPIGSCWQKDSDSAAHGQRRGRASSASRIPAQTVPAAASEREC